eukprot:g38992.t1
MKGLCQTSTFFILFRPLSVVTVRQKEPRVSVILSNLKRQVGSWELIFPFSPKTLESAQSIAPQVLKKDGYPGVAIGNFKRAAVSAIRARTRIRKKAVTKQRQETDTEKTSGSGSDLPASSPEVVSTGSEQWPRSKAPLPEEFPEIIVRAPSEPMSDVASEDVPMTDVEASTTDEP